MLTTSSKSRLKCVMETSLVMSAKFYIALLVGRLGNSACSLRSLPELKKGELMRVLGRKEDVHENDI